MNKWQQLVLSIKRGADVGGKNYLLLAAPLLAAGLGFESLRHGLHALFPGGKHYLLDGVLLLAVCIPLGLIAEGVLASAYVDLRTSGAIHSQVFGRFLRKRGLMSRVGRLLAMTLVWLAIAFAAVCLIFAVALFFIGFLRSLTQHHASSHSPILGRVFLWTWVAVYGYLSSRYAFVLPRFAMQGEDDERRCWDQAVAEAKLFQPILGLFCAFACLCVVVLSWLIIHAGRPAHQTSTVMVFLSVGICGLLNAYFETVKVDLALAESQREA